MSYANDLSQALREGGWEVSGPYASPGCAATPEVGVGIDDLASPHPSAWLLVDVLTAVGINVKVVKAVDVRPGDCCLIVGGESRSMKSRARRSNT